MTAETIRVERLYKSFGENHVLRGIDLTFPKGTTTVILGGSGSGKSVLMKHLIGLMRPDEGRVLVDGEDIASLRGTELTALRAKFGDGISVGRSVRLDERLGECGFSIARASERPFRDQIRASVAEKLALFDLRGVEQKFPADLSGGMRKRVGLARAIIMDPTIVLYDEPTTGLDPITTDYVDEMIKQAKRSLGVTSVVISHDIASAFNVADYIAFLYDGNIVAYGPPQQVKASEHPFVHRFLGTWFRKN